MASEWQFVIIYMLRMEAIPPTNHFLNGSDLEDLVHFDIFLLGGGGANCGYVFCFAK